VGGNVTRGPRLALSLSALGAAPRGGAWTRAGGRAGDVLWVSGRLGLARAGLLWLLAEGDPGDALLAPGLARLLAPAPRLDLVAPLRAAGVRAGMDLSDGLCRDLPRLLLASGLAARVDSARLPAPSPALGARLGRRPAELAWVGGEDYELLVAGPADLGARCPGADLTAIGELVAGPPGQVTLAGPLAGERFAGFDHLE
jgi:thiamine-monophosphate kinase